MSDMWGRWSATQDAADWADLEDSQMIDARCSEQVWRDEVLFGDAQ